MKADTKKLKVKKMKWMKPELEYLGGIRPSKGLPIGCIPGSSDAFNCGPGTGF